MQNVCDSNPKHIVHVFAVTRERACLYACIGRGVEEEGQRERGPCAEKGTFWIKYCSYHSIHFRRVTHALKKEEYNQHCIDFVTQHESGNKCGGKR